MPAQPTFSLHESSRSRKRHRYIGFIITAQTGVQIDREELKKALRYYCKKKFGQHWREVGLKLTRYNGKEGIVHCYHLYKDQVIYLLNSIKKIFDKNVEITTVGTSGTIKSLNRKFFGGRLKKEHDPDYTKKKV